MPDGASLFRHSLHPIVFKGRKTFAPQKMFRLEDDETDNVVSSVVWQKYVPTQRHVHGYGCRLSSKINDRRRLEGKLNDKNRHIYCGAYHLTAFWVRELGNGDDVNSPIKAAEVNHLPEDGEIAHTEIRFILNPETPDIEGAKTEIVARLWDGCSGPLMFVCDDDRDVPDHPSENLRPGPLGGYTDTRTRWSRLRDLVRFHVCRWIMRRLGRVPTARR